MIHNDEVIQAVVCMLAIDGEIDELETRFLYRLAQRLGVARETVESALEKAKRGKGSVCIPDDPADGKRVLNFLIQAAVVNGEVTPQERKMLHAVTAKIGIPTQYIEEALKIGLKKVFDSKQPKGIVEPQPPEADSQLNNVIFEGKIIQGKSLPNVKKNLAALFKMNMTGIEKVFTGQPVAIKEKIKHETALKLQKAFEQAGGQYARLSR